MYWYKMSMESKIYRNDIVVKAICRFFWGKYSVSHSI